ncbi:MAG: SUMF1/EgtB/PvdO family nonheme iron enzyme [Bradymonadales bacterium]
MGRPGSDPWGEDNEKPSHEVTLSAYMIDRYLVTAASYKLCVEAGKCNDEHLIDNGSQYRENCTYNVEGKEKHPINCVTWEQATSYCEWARGRLPTEAEWERAAKGESHRRFPWGDECPRSWNTEICSGAEWTEETAKANCYEERCHDGFEYTSPVNQFPSGMSPDGLYDMAGNLWEWTSDWSMRKYTEDSVTNPTGSADDAEKRVVRGGAWGARDKSYLRTVYRATSPSSYIYPNTIGFRCASSALDISSSFP